MEGPVRVGVVGMGGFARTHLRYVNRAVERGLAVHAAQVALPADQQAFAREVGDLRQHGVEIYPSLRALLAGARQRLDLVCVPVGVPWHRPMVEAVLEAGCHVLVEKPAAGSVQDVDAMIAARQRAGRLAALGFQHLYDKPVQALKEWICQGHLGRITRVKAVGSWPAAAVLLPAQRLGRTAGGGRYLGARQSAPQRPGPRGQFTVLSRVPTRRRESDAGAFARGAVPGQSHRFGRYGGFSHAGGGGR